MVSWVEHDAAWKVQHLIRLTHGEKSRAAEGIGVDPKLQIVLTGLEAFR